MSARQVLVLYFLLLLSLGAVAGHYALVDRLPPRGFGPLFLLVTTALLYVWYYRDAAEQKFQRSARLGGAVILVSILAIPYYLWRSRPPGRRGRALLKFAGLFVLSFVVVLLGELAVMLYQKAWP
jgi:hypothetical protein